jgi:Na+/proline symporter
MSFAAYAITFIGIYMLAMVAIGVWIARRETTGDFIIGGRKVGLLPTAASLAASFRDGAGIALWLTLGLHGGYGPAFWFFTAIGVSAFVISYFGPRVRQQAEEFNHLTMSERVEQFIGPHTARLTAIVTLVFSLFLIALQYHIAGGVFARMLGWQPVWGIALVMGILITYLVMGGYKSVIITDTIQFFIIVSFIALPLFVQPTLADIGNVASIVSGTLDETLSYVFGGFFLLLVLPECWQRIMSARDMRTVKWSMPLAVLLLVIMTLSLVWFGMGLRLAVPDINMAEPYFDLFTGEGKLPAPMLGYIALVFIAITMSTQSASCYAFVATLGKVLMKSSVNTDRKYMYFSRIAMVVVLIVSAALALLISDVIRYFFDVLGFIIVLAPIYIVAAMTPTPWLGNTPAARAELDRTLVAITLVAIALYLVLFLTDASKITLNALNMPVLMASVVTGLYVWRRKLAYKG